MREHHPITQPTSRTPSSHHPDTPRPPHHVHNLLLQHRTPIHPSRPYKIPQPTQNQHTPRHHDRVIHRVGLHGRRGRPHGPEDDEDHVRACVSVVEGTQEAG